MNIMRAKYVESFMIQDWKKEFGQIFIHGGSKKLIVVSG